MPYLQTVRQNVSLNFSHNIERFCEGEEKGEKHVTAEGQEYYGSSEISAARRSSPVSHFSQM